MVYGDDPGNIVPNNEAITQSVNLYGYCMQNPTRYIDLTGNTAQDANEYAKNNPKPYLQYRPQLPSTITDYRTDLDHWWDGYCDAYNLNNTGPKMVNYTGEETKVLIEEAKKKFDIDTGKSVLTSARYIPKVSSWLSTLISKVLPFVPEMAPNPVSIGISVGLKTAQILGDYGTIYELEKWNADGSGIVYMQDEIFGYTLPIGLWDIVDFKDLSYQGDVCPYEE